MDSAAENVVPTIEAMRRQEETVYICTDYLYQQQLLREEAGNPAMGPQSSYIVSPNCREKMVQWCFKVVDFCQFRRETVAIAMSIMDRFLMSKQGRSVIFNSAEFQLAAMTSLYTAVKIHEPEVMSAELVSTLSRGAHTDEAVETMERTILLAIAWHVNPPTALSFIREFLKLLPPVFLDEGTKANIFEVSKYQSELVVADYSLVTVPASTIAYASLINAMESLCSDHTVLGYVSDIVSHAAQIDVRSQALVYVQFQLCEAVTQQAQPSTTNVKTSRAHPSSYGMTEKGVAPRRTSYKASPCTVTRMEV